ncbi:hypothetical protein ACTI_44000 [Actinoplanes sp. OR16]|nr:hypothetical protein ACTI_44000 [Actinoplanes sp. OR16]
MIAGAAQAAEVAVIAGAAQAAEVAVIAGAAQAAEVAVAADAAHAAAEGVAEVQLAAEAHVRADQRRWPRPSRLSAATAAHVSGAAPKPDASHARDGKDHAPDNASERCSNRASQQYLID